MIDAQTYLEHIASYGIRPAPVHVGRVPPSALDTSGDASLLDRCQERVRI